MAGDANGGGGAAKPSAGSGIGIAGSAVVDIVTDKTLATVATSEPIAAASLTVSTDDTQGIYAVSGAVALTAAGKGESSGSKTIAGAFGLNLLTSDTASTLSNTALNGPGAIGVSAHHGGVLATLNAGIAGNATADGKAFAGSVSVNRVVDTTAALVSGVTTSATGGSLSVTSLNDAQVIAIGSGASFAIGSKGLGVGAALGYNQITGDTTAEVAASADITVAGDATVSATNNNAIRAVGISAGVSTSGSAAAFTIGINILSTSSSIFGAGATNGIAATVDHSHLHAGGNVSVLANDESVIQSAAGALAIGLGSRAFGIGLSWNQVVLGIDAAATSARIEAGGVLTINASSTQSDPVYGGKISSAAIAGAVGNGVAVGASVSIDGVQNTVAALVDSASQLSAAGMLAVGARDQSTISTLVGGVAISIDSTGVGAAVGANYIANTVTATVNGSAASTGDAVQVTAREDADIEAITAGLAGADAAAIGGSVSIDVLDNTVRATVGSAANVSAQGVVTVAATQNATAVAVAGQVSIAGEVGVGASVTSLTVTDTTEAVISGDARVAGVAGVSLSATNTENLTDFAIVGAGGGTVGVGGAVTATVIDDPTRAYVSATDINQRADFGVSSTLGNVTIGAGVDAGVVLRTTEAYVGAGATVTAGGDVTVDATASETI